MTVEVGKRDSATNAPAWIPKADLAEGQKQALKLVAIGPAPLYFAGVVLDWSKADPDDPRVPEAPALFRPCHPLRLRR